MNKAITVATVAAISNAYDLDQVENGVNGFDISQPMSTTTATCMKNSGYTTMIARAWTSTGKVDTSVCTSLNAAKAAGITYRDVYMFPCPTCSTSASSQLTSMVNYLKANCSASWSGKVWLDIEGSQYWTGSTTSNRSWYQGLVDACKANASSCGVYSSYY